MYQCDCSNFGTILFSAYPDTVYPGATFTVTGTVSASVTGSNQIQIGTTANKLFRPANFILATMNGLNWTATINSEYLSFYVWAELQLIDNIYIVTPLILSTTATPPCDLEKSGDHSISPQQREEYYVDNRFYYGET